MELTEISIIPKALEDFIEPIVTPEQNPIQIEQSRLDVASEVAFGLDDSKLDELGYYDGLVNYDTAGDTAKEQQAALAMVELFKAGADLEAVKTLEALENLKPYSDEALALQKPGPKEIAYDYIMGNRTRPESARVANAVFAEYVNEAYDRQNKFWKERYDDRSRKDKKMGIVSKKVIKFGTDFPYQINKAREFANKRYHLDVPNSVSAGDKNISREDIRHDGPQVWTSRPTTS